MASLVLQTSFVGDIILTTPLLTELAARGPIDVLTTPIGASVLRGHKAVREVLVYDKRGADSGIFGFRRLAQRVRERGYDTAYIAQSSIRTGMLAWIAGIPTRIGLEGAPGVRFYTSAVAHPSNRHQAERLWRLAFPSGKPGEFMPEPSLFPGDAERIAVDELLGIDPRPLVTFAPGSAWATKRWPYYEQLAEDIAKDARLAVIGGPDDVTFGEIIRVKVPDVVLAAGKLSLLGSAELIRRSRVIVTNDSSPTHLASAVGTPTIVVYGPTIPGFGFGPLAPEARIVQLERMPCRPCHHHGPRKCPLGHWKCMVELGVPRVSERVRELLAID